MALYAAYGSNMNLEQMSFRCPDAKVVGKGVITGYVLMFRGHRENAHATIQYDHTLKKDNAGVPVLLWEISEKDEKNLDRYEGFPSYYYKDTVDVFVGIGEKKKAMVYIMQDGNNINLPSESYFNVILEGYVENDIDTEYLFERMKAVTRSVK